MISTEDCEFIKKFEVANSEEKQVILTNEGHQVNDPCTLFVYFHLFSAIKLLPSKPSMAVNNRFFLTIVLSVICKSHQITSIERSWSHLTETEADS